MFVFSPVIQSKYVTRARLINRIVKPFFLVCILLLNQIAFSKNPQLSFFNEQDGKDVKELFSDSTLIPILKELHAEVRMGILDLSQERVEVIKRLNEASIPVVAWLLLPKEEGYWFHSGNAEQAFERYYEIKKWGEDTGIKFSGIGIDLELDYNDMELFKNNKLKLFGELIGRLYAKEKFLQAKAAYKKLIETIRNDGYMIESYYVPVVRYETERGQTALQQVSKFMDLKTDKDIPMLYTSFMGNPYGTLKALAIDKNLEYVAIGSTGGGFDPTMPSMTWEDLAYDLRVAAKTAKEIHIFCLEATVEKGFLQDLIDFDYEVPVIEYPEQVEAVNSMINRLMWISTILSYPTLFLTAIMVLLGVIVWILYLLVKFFKNRILFPV